MEYTVEIYPDEMAIEYISYIAGLTAEEAEEQAELSADENQVFITWFRGSDGQHGYLNRDGHGPTGKAW